jgi:hypothetical protein
MAVFDRFESTRLVVEIPQVVVHEADQPDVVSGLLHAHILAGQDLTEIDLVPLVADAAAAGHDGGPVVERVIELLEALRGARGGECKRLAGVAISRT